VLVVSYSPNYNPSLEKVIKNHVPIEVLFDPAPKTEEEWTWCKICETLLVTTVYQEPTPEIRAGRAVVEIKSSAKSDKLGLGLVMIPMYSIYKIGKIFIEGLRYGRDNWKKGVFDTTYQEERLEHAFNHLMLWKEGNRSEEHLAKVAWFCITQMELERMEAEGLKNEEENQEAKQQ
jgi:hypothetical protein